MSCLGQVPPRQKPRQRGQCSCRREQRWFSPHPQTQLTGFGWSLHPHLGSWDPAGFVPFTPQTQIQGIVRKSTIFITFSLTNPRLVKTTRNY